MEHLHHFQLSEDPFRNDHVERFQCETPTQADALRRLDRGVRQSRGLNVLVGGVGSGKTIVARKLYEELEEEVFEASMMVVLRRNVGADWLLDRFARELGVEDPAQGREARIGQIYERLAIIREDGRHAVLIIDDAHSLATEDTLSEICGLVKLEYEDRGLLSVVLVGASPLDDALAADPLLGQRVDVRVNLAPLGRDAAAAYLAHRIQVAGGDPKLLLPGAVAALHELSGGAPGRLNTLADNALYEAYLAGRTELTRSDVDRAFAELGWASARQGAPARKPSAASARRAPPAQAETPSPDAHAAGDALDSELEAVFEPSPPARGSKRAEAHQTVLMDFDAEPEAVPAQRPMPARAAAAPTEIQLEPSDAISAPPKEDEVDDLFMELLDD